MRFVKDLGFMLARRILCRRGGEEGDRGTADSIL